MGSNGWPSRIVSVALARPLAERDQHCPAVAGQASTLGPFARRPASLPRSYRACLHGCVRR